MGRLLKLSFSLTVIIALSGCATNRGYLNVLVPSAVMSGTNGKQVYIRSITDNRIFQDKPSSADVPSAGFGGLKKITPEIKSRVIARKRNSFGKAMGDILLEEGRTVQKVVHEASETSLHMLGYDVVDKEEEANPDAIIIDISIDKFWGWFLPGMWAISLKSEIATTNTIAMPGKSDSIVIKAEARNVCQVGNDANWKKVFTMVIDDFIGKAKAKFENIDAGK